MSENICGIIVNPVCTACTTVANRGKLSVVAELAVDFLIAT